MKKAAVCIATCYRTRGLRSLLEDLAQQEVPVGWKVEIRVVCNEPEVDQRRFAQSVYSIIPEAIITFESMQNIARARNAAIQLGVADAFLFIDDDERPNPCWLRSLLMRIDNTQIDAVFGPVYGRQSGHAPLWLERTGAFNKLGPDHDGEINWTQTRTSSAAVSGDLLGENADLFDPDYGVSGGSDTELFLRLSRKGARFVHERAAFVYEDNEKSRCSWISVLRRRYKAGAVYGRMKFNDKLSNAAWFTLSRGLYGAGVMIGGTLPLVLGKPQMTFNGACRFVIAVGAWRGRSSSYKIIRYKPVTH
ncbi:MAG: glycosyltransferase [Phycisphaerales bacterium]|nr:glycosyltransferase [Phycisphaerales bacterium]